jgi:hypothetical protein
LIDEKEGHRFVAELQLFYRFQGRSARVSRDNPVAIAIMAAEITLHGPEYVRVVVHSPNDRFWHKGRCVTDGGPAGGMSTAGSTRSVKLS